MTGIMVVKCPNAVSVGRAGFTSTGFTAGSSAVSFDRVTRPRGDWMTIVRFDPAAGMKTVLRATGSGPVEVVIAHGLMGGHPYGIALHGQSGARRIAEPKH